MRRFLVSLILSLTLVWAVQAVPLQGLVTDAATGNPLPDVNVSTADGSGRATTGLDGRFRLDGLSEGSSLTLNFSHIGYSPQSIALTPGASLHRIEMTPADVKLGEVVVRGGRSVAKETPGAVSNISSAELSKANSVMEPPQLARLIPNAVSFNWGGGTLGPMHLRIRGFDMDKQSVTINGVPLTDPEDHITYWQDTPDLLTSVHDVQVERGVSSFASGPPGLAGGLNLVTRDAVANRETALTYLLGTHNTERRTFFYRSGLVDEKYNFTGRFSRVASDGYRDHSGAVEWAYFLAATRYDPNHVMTFETWGGEEITQMNFTAIPKAILDTNRAYNPEANYDLRINGHVYDGQKDRFQQPHYILRDKWRIAPGIDYEGSLYFIRGSGFYEQFKRGRDFGEYNLDTLWRYDAAGNREAVFETDLIRRKAVDKYEVGWAPRLKIDNGNGELFQMGLELRQYRSIHYGRIFWARDLPPNAGPEREYNRWKNKKIFLGGWGSYDRRLTDAVKLNAGLALRSIRYNVWQTKLGAFPGYEYDVDWTFILPRAGINWRLNERTSLYASAAMAGLEPVDNQMFDPDNPHASAPNPNRVKPQRMTDIELGVRRDFGAVETEINAYAMFFTDEIVHTGVYDPATDELVVTNAPTSTHLGIELTAKAPTPVEGLTASGDVSLDRSTFGDFTFHYVDSIDGNWSYLDETVEAEGNRIPLTPYYVANLRLDYARGRFAGGLNWQAVSRQFLDPREDERWSLDPYSTLGATARLSLPVRSVELEFSIEGMNLLDKEYEPYGWTETVDPYLVNPSGPPTRGAYQPMFIPAAGRMLIGGMTVRF